MGTKRWRTIMVVVKDPFARDQLAATKAAAVARRCGARVLLFNTFMIPQPVPDVPMGARDEIIASAIRQRRARLESIAAGLRLPPGVKCVARWDYPIDEAIVRQVREARPDLLISESHRHGRLARILLANTDWKLMSNCPCPLWFVRSKVLASRPRVLVAVDPRHAHAKPARLDDRLLQAARGFTSQLDGRIQIVHACDIDASGEPGKLKGRIRARHRSPQATQFIATTTELVWQLAQKHGISSDDCTLQDGPADDVIAAEAKRYRADVLVMGAVSRSFRDRSVIGGTAERVIDQVDCDVFVVKPMYIKTRGKRPLVRGRLRRGNTTARATAVRSPNSRMTP